MTAETGRDDGKPIVRIEGVSKWYGQFQVLHDIDLEVQAGERIVICGPSGSGKSTLIRCINRLETVEKGRIVVDGIDLTAGGRNTQEVRREVGMVFQQFNLFPHMTVLENCTLAPMRSRGMSREEAEPAFGRPAAARGDRTRAVHVAAHHAVRRADLGARPGNGEGSTRHHGRPG